MNAPPAVESLRAQSPADIARAWREHDVAVFLAGMESVPSLNPHALAAEERDRFAGFQTRYFRERFLKSRSLAAHAAGCIAPEGAAGTVCRDPAGVLRVAGVPEAYVGFSYTGTLLAAAFSRVPCGIDVEEIRPGPCPALVRIAARHGAGDGDHGAVLRAWTGLEASCKLTATPLSDALSGRAHTGGVPVSWRIVDGRYLLAIACREPEPAVCIVRVPAVPG